MWEFKLMLKFIGSDSWAVTRGESRHRLLVVVLDLCLVLGIWLDSFVFCVRRRLHDSYRVKPWLKASHDIRCSLLFAFGLDLFWFQICLFGAESHTALRVEPWLEANHSKSIIRFGYVSGLVWFRIGYVLSWPRAT